MADHVLDRGRLAEAVGNDIADMAQFWSCASFSFWSRRAHSSK